MALFRVYGRYCVSRLMGVVEAETEEAAAVRAAEKYEGDTLGLCWQCNELAGDDLACGSFFVEQKEIGDVPGWLVDVDEDEDEG